MCIRDSEKAEDFAGTVDTISIVDEISTSDKVNIAVSVNTVQVEEKAYVSLKADVKKLMVSKEAASSKVEVAKGATISTFVANANTSITGSGDIDKLEANADDIKISSSTNVNKTEVADGVKKPSTGSSSGSSSGRCV